SSLVTRSHYGFVLNSSVRRHRFQKEITMKRIGLLLLLIVLPASAQVPTVADKGAPARITITNRDEPGERLIVTGRVFGPDGVTPVPGASVYVYHTDVKGYYSPGT